MDLRRSDRQPAVVAGFGGAASGGAGQRQPIHHISNALKGERPTLAGQGNSLYSLPAFSPELNRIEPVFRQVKYQEIPVRSYTSRAALRQAVEHGFDSYTGKLGRKSGKQLRPAA